MDARAFKKSKITHPGAAGRIVNPSQTPQSLEGRQDTNLAVTEAHPSEATEPPAGGEVPEQDSIKTYLEYLEQHDIHKAELLEVLDSIVTTGDVLWSFKALNRIEVVLHMRPAWVNEHLLAKLESQPPKIYARFAGVVGTYNLAGSLCSYNGKAFSVETPEELEEVAAFVGKLPFALQNILVKQLAIFDRVVAVATSDWALENFTTPQPGE